jgi:hypothetical protein
MLKNETEMLNMVSGLPRLLRNDESLIDAGRLQRVARHVTMLLMVTDNRAVYEAASVVEALMNELSSLMRNMSVYGCLYVRGQYYYGHPYADAHADWVRRDSLKVFKLMKDLALIIEHFLNEREAA